MWTDAPGGTSQVRGCGRQAGDCHQGSWGVSSGLEIRELEHLAVGAAGREGREEGRGRKIETESGRISGEREREGEWEDIGRAGEGGRVGDIGRA